jgi:type III pantothenate kinase
VNRLPRQMAGARQNEVCGSCVQLDVGNSSAKWRLQAAGEIVARGSFDPRDRGSAAALLGCAPPPERIWVASVAAPRVESELAAMLRARWGVEPWFARTAGRTGDLCNSYADPARMGVDRWLAMLGARQRQRARLCVVDAGSALTIDIVAADGCHEGGYIVPGPGLMERALLLDTGRVRFAEEAAFELSPGVSTAESVRHGIALAQAGALALALERAGQPAPALWFCGGGGAALMALLGRGGTCAPDLVFEGLEAMARLGS